VTTCTTATNGEDIRDSVDTRHSSAARCKTSPDKGSIVQLFCCQMNTIILRDATEEPHLSTPHPPQPPTPTPTPHHTHTHNPPTPPTPTTHLQAGWRCKLRSTCGLRASCCHQSLRLHAAIPERCFCQSQMQLQCSRPLKASRQQRQAIHSRSANV
jgi:hypothetical protein